MENENKDGRKEQEQTEAGRQGGYVEHYRSPRHVGVTTDYQKARNDISRNNSSRGR